MSDEYKDQPEAQDEASLNAEANENAAHSEPTGRAETDDYSERLERLGGEPAPVITPEEFARLQRAGQVHIDARGRVRTARRSDAEAGVSLRKRRAWYAEAWNAEAWNAEAWNAEAWNAEAWNAEAWNADA